MRIPYIHTCGIWRDKMLWYDTAWPNYAVLQQKQLWLPCPYSSSKVLMASCNRCIHTWRASICLMAVSISPTVLNLRLDCRALRLLSCPSSAALALALSALTSAQHNTTQHKTRNTCMTPETTHGDGSHDTTRHVQIDDGADNLPWLWPLHGGHVKPCCIKKKQGKTKF